MSEGNFPLVTEVRGNVKRQHCHGLLKCRNLSYSECGIIPAVCGMATFGVVFTRAAAIN